ncbi:hypothetical protein FOZ61_009301 [Perkinsus olseni]|uniref:Uncharacterized protein n=1 Tax=Perkinsus olseni TaxID=32597 RepID=A0A7J6M5F0_PEROL|nr:hypothetical protein FOZ61_009301 [Perkinsus olseni]
MSKPLLKAFVLLSLLGPFELSSGSKPKKVPRKCGLRLIGPTDFYLELAPDYQRIEIFRRNELRLIPTDYLTDRSVFSLSKHQKKCEQALSTYLHRGVDLDKTVPKPGPMHLPPETPEHKRKTVSTTLKRLDRGKNGIFKAVESEFLDHLLGILFEEASGTILEQGKSISAVIAPNAHSLVYKFNQIVCGGDAKNEWIPAEYRLQCRADSNHIESLSDGILSLYPGPFWGVEESRRFRLTDGGGQGERCCCDETLARWLHSASELETGHSTPYSEEEIRQTVEGLAEHDDSAVNTGILKEWESSLEVLYRKISNSMKEGSISGYFMRSDLDCIARFSSHSNQHRFNGHYGLAVKKNGFIEAYFSSEDDVNFLKPLVQQSWGIYVLLPSSSPRESGKADSCQKKLIETLKSRSSNATRPQTPFGLARYGAKQLELEPAWKAISSWENDPRLYQLHPSSLASKLIVQTMEAMEVDPDRKKHLRIQRQVLMRDDTVCHFTAFGRSGQQYALGLNQSFGINYIHGEEMRFYKPEGSMAELQKLLVFPRLGISNVTTTSELCKQVYIAYLIAAAAATSTSSERFPTLDPESCKEESERRFTTTSLDFALEMKKLISIARKVDTFLLEDYSEPKALLSPL